MKTFVRRAVMLTAVAAMCQAGIVLADELRWLSDGGQTATVVGDEKAPAAPQNQAACANGVSCCEESGCESCCDPCDCMMGCDDCPWGAVVGFAGFDAFKGVSDVNLQSNFGAVAGLNAGVPIPGLSDRGLGWQLGMSYGVYDWDGRTTLQTAEAQQQVFVTTGFFRKANDDQRLSFGLVYDWMINQNWGYTAVDPTLGQWRGQIEWAFSGRNAVGLWGCVRDRRSDILIQQVALVSNRPMTQGSVFWHHKFESNADSWLWFGCTEQDRLDGDGSLGDWIIGAAVQMPISDRLALYGNAQYMHPSAAAGLSGSVESAWNVGMGLAWYFGGNARSDKINGKCWVPYMPVANNSTFLVDQAITAP